MKLKNVELNILKDTDTEFEMNLKGEKEIERPVEYHEPFSLHKWDEEKGGFYFHSENLKSIQWNIHNGSDLTGIGGEIENLTSPFVPTPGIRDLKNGSYSLTLSGKSTSGTPTKTLVEPIEITMGKKPEDPELPACVRGPTITRIFDISKNGFSYQFDGEGIHLIKEKFSGQAHESVPTSNIIRVEAALFPGDHTLSIEGGNCKSPVSSKTFTVPKDEPTDPEEPKEKFKEYPTAEGTLKVQGNTQDFEFIQAEGLDIEVLEGDLVRLKFADTSTSETGKTVYPFLLDENMIQIPDSEVEALKKGVKLKAKNYGFNLYYLSGVNSFEDYHREIWNLFGEGRHRQNAGKYRQAYISIRNKDGSMDGVAGEIKDDPRFKSATWTPDAYRYPDITLKMPRDKLFAPTKMLHSSEKSVAEHLTKVTHLQWSNGDIPVDRAWSTVQTFPDFSLSYSGTKGDSGEITIFDSRFKKGMLFSFYHTEEKGNFSISLSRGRFVDKDGEFTLYLTKKGSGSDFLISARIFNTIEGMFNHWIVSHKDHPLFGEQCENGLDYDITLQHRKMSFEKIKRENQGITHPNQTWNALDYFAALYGYGTDGGGSYATRRKYMASKAMAKKFEYDGKVHDMAFYQGPHEYTNRMTGRYWDSAIRSGLGAYVYKGIQNLEQQFMAEPSLKVIGFSWISQEGAEEQIIRGANTSKLRIKAKNGDDVDLLRACRAEFGFEFNKSATFFGLLLGNGQVSWHDNGKHSTDTKNWDQAHIGGWADWKTKIHNLKTGEIRNFDLNRDDHPQLLQNTTGRFGDTPVPGHNGEFAAAKLYEEIAVKNDYVSLSVAYTPYTFDGSTFVPKAGSEGLEVSRYGVSNEGQDNICTLGENRLPVVFKTKGTSGSLLVIKHPFGGVLKQHKITVDGREYEFQGGMLTVVKI